MSTGRFGEALSPQEHRAPPVDRRYIAIDDPVAISRVKTVLTENATRNSELLSTLEKTSEAPKAFAFHSTHLSILEEEIKKQESAVQALEEEVAQRLRSHKKFRDSTTRKWIYRVTAMRKKFEELAKSEEAKYHEGLQERNQAERRRQKLQVTFTQADAEGRGLESSAKLHGETHQAIDKLYESIFAGPTPGFPNEDDCEQTFHIAKKKHENKRLEIVSARRGVQLLSHAHKRMSRAQTLIEYAQQNANSSLLRFHAAYNDLGLANDAASHACGIVDQAVQAMKPLTPAMEASFNDVDRLVRAGRVKKESDISREALLFRIKDAQLCLAEASKRIVKLQELTKEREKQGRLDIRTTASTLEEARQALQEVRQQAFEHVVGFGAAPPPYHECCNREDAFCQLPPLDTTEIHAIVGEDPEDPSPAYEHSADAHTPAQLDLPPAQSQREVGQPQDLLSPVSATPSATQERRLSATGSARSRASSLQIDTSTETSRQPSPVNERQFVPLESPAPPHTATSSSYSPAGYARQTPIAPFTPDTPQRKHAGAGQTPNTSSMLGGEVVVSHITRKSLGSPTKFADDKSAVKGYVDAASKYDSEFRGSVVRS